MPAAAGDKISDFYNNMVDVVQDFSDFLLRCFIAKTSNVTRFFFFFFKIMFFQKSGTVF